MNIQGLQRIVLLALPLLAFVCGQAHPPVIQNTLERPIALAVTYSNGQSFSADFPPGATVWSPAEGIAVDQIEVRSEGKLLFKLERADLERLASGFSPGTPLMWSIREDGVIATAAPE
jgi:hypothetical protein